jgi:hypothetical protein
MQAMGSYKDDSRKACVPAIGTVVACQIDHPTKHVSGSFVTTTSLSDRERNSSLNNSA